MEGQTQHEDEGKYCDEGEEYEEVEYEVEQLLAKRRNKETKVEEFKVLWAGFDIQDPDGTSWEPIKWLQDQGYDDLIDTFEVEKKKQADQGKRSAGADKKKSPVTGTTQGASSSLAALDTSFAVNTRVVGQVCRYLLDVFPSFDNSSQRLSCGRRARPHPRAIVAKEQFEEKLRQQEHEDAIISPEQAAVRKVQVGAAATTWTPPQQYLNTQLDDWVTGLEQLLLRDLPLLRCLATCRWDVEASWQEYTGVMQALADKKKMATNEYEVEHHFDGSPTEDNMFLLAPTTFHESADILLTVMSFCSSHTFFTASLVNRRWHHVGAQMLEVRGMAFDAAKGLRDSLADFGLCTVAVGSSGATHSDTAAFLRCLKRERVVLKDRDDGSTEGVYYDGENGGAVWPMMNITEKIQREPADGVFRVLNPAPGTEGTAQHAEELWPGPLLKEEITFTLCLGRGPSQSSHGRVSAVSACTTVTHVSPAAGLNLPIFTIRALVLGGESMCRKTLFSNTDYNGISSSDVTPLVPIFSIPFNPVNCLLSAIKQKKAQDIASDSRRRSALHALVEKELREKAKNSGKKEKEGGPRLIVDWKAVRAEVNRRERAFQKSKPPQAPLPRSLVEQVRNSNFLSPNYGTLAKSGAKITTYGTSLVVYQERWMLIHKTRKRWRDFVFTLPAPVVFSPANSYRLHEAAHNKALASRLRGEAATSSPVRAADPLEWERLARESVFRRMAEDPAVDLMAPVLSEKQLRVLRELHPAVFGTKTADPIGKKDLASHGW